MAWRVLIGADGSQRAEDLARLVAQSGGEYIALLAADWPDLLDRAGRGEAEVVLWACAAGRAAQAAQALGRRAPGLPLLLVLEPWQAEPAAQALALGALDCLEGRGLEAKSLALAMAPARQAAWLRTRRYQSIVEHQTELICRFEPEGVLTFVNQAFANYFGYDLSKIIGNNLFGLLPGHEAQNLRGLLSKLTPLHPVARMEHIVGAPQGEERWLKWTICGIFDPQGRLLEIQSVGRDITERVRVQETLHMVEASLRQLIVDNADGLIVTSQDGLVLFVNPAAERIMGTRSWDLVGRPFAFSLATGEHQEMCLVSPQGHKLVMQTRVVPTKWQGQPALLASLRDITELVRLREQLQGLTLVDELTGLYNRRGFLHLADQQVKTAQRMGRRLYLFFIDVDDLKLINDRLGHAEGDNALVAASQVLKETFRASDIVARMGGDEFAALALEGEEQTAEPIVGRLEGNLQAWRRQGLHPFRLSLSVGTTVYDPAAPRPLEELLQEADQRMYQHKRGKPPASAQAG